MTLQTSASGIYSAGLAADSRGNGNPYYAGVFPGGQMPPLLQQSTYPQQTGALAVGTVGFGWRDAIISKTGTTIEWFLGGLKIATFNNSTLAASNVFLGYWDSYASVSDNAALSFGLADNVRVERFVTNVPPFLTAPPLAQSAKTASNATFTVTAGGTAPLSYQWRFHNLEIPGATYSSYTRSNLTANDAGNYSVAITNVAGSVISSPALLTVTPPIPPQFNNLTVLDGNQLKLMLTGEPGRSITIWKSGDLLAWESVTNLPNPTGTLEFIAVISPGIPQRFYRAQLGP